MGSVSGHAPHEPWPQIPYGGGLSDASARVVLISWGIGSSAVYPYQPILDAWAQRVFSGTYVMDAAHEYGVTSSSFAGAVHLPGSPAGSLNDGQLQAQISSLLGSPAVPSPTAGTVYVFLFSSSTVFTSSLGMLCTDYSGYHSALTYGGQPIPYAVVGQCGTLPAYRLNEVQSIEVIVSHEVLEAVTDPLLGTAWSYPAPIVPYDPWATEANEIGDGCDHIATAVNAGGDYAQRIFSNGAARLGGDPCLPSVGTPLAAVSSLPYSVVMRPGATVNLPVVGWSTSAATSFVALLLRNPLLMTTVPPAIPTDSMTTVTITAGSATGTFHTALIAGGTGLSESTWPVQVEVR
jgi:hypothetical protein